MSRLTAREREVVCTIADDEDAWHVFTDSTRLTRKILRVAARWGVTPERCGAGWEFTFPLGAVRLVGPQRMTAREKARRERLRQGLQNGRSAPKTSIAHGAAEGPGPRGVS